jgi:hypothetical protein
MKPQTNFNPDAVAYYEKAGWEAYYDRNWLRAFALLVRLNREQFRMNWFIAILAAIDTVRASIAFAPLDKSDVAKATYHIGKFYEKARRSLGMKAGAPTLAALEIDYWVVHRQLAIARAQDTTQDNSEPMVQSLAKLHAALFDSTPEKMRASAELRALAAKTVDLITSKRSINVPDDWRKVESYLQQAYRQVRRDA